ncbi:MAG: serine hydrolase [Muribaculaceae bacterium]|nr:serine hydrolase [Muribaculaceae bacterium]
MTRFKRVLLLTITAAITVAAMARGTSEQPYLFNDVDQVAMERWVDSVFNSMSDEARIGQLIIAAVTPSTNDATRALVQRLVTQNKVGGLIYEKSTIAEQASITNLAQSLATVPLMITIDGEWGLGMRLKDVPNFQRNLILGAVDNDMLLYEYGREVARQCRRMGIQVNFAPVLDVNDNPDNPVIGDRSFGENPELVARHAIAFARGLEDGGVMAVGKHFPGHGSSSEDSHKTLPVINKSMQEINTCELLPFRKFIDAGLSGILTAHLLVPSIEDEQAPTSLSHASVTNLLRDHMNFKGLIFTDALNMKGATQLLHGSACVNALLAGNDVLLMPEDVTGEINAIKNAVAGGTLQQSVIDERCKKILRYKYALNLTSPQHVNTANLANDVNSQHAGVLKRQLMAGSITVIKNNDNILPIHNLQSRHIAVATIGNESGTTATFQRRCADYAQVKRFDLAKAGSADNLAEQLHDGHFNTIIVEVGEDNAANRAALDAVVKKCKNIIVVITSKPYDIKNYGKAITHKHVKAVVLTYENSSLAEDYAAQTIFGGNAAGGNLPVSLAFEGKKTRYEAGHGIHYPANRLGYSIPAEVGLDNRLTAQIDSVCRLGVQQHAFPGCQVIVARHGKIVYKGAFGAIDYGNPNKVDDNTLFGLASVSKATGTISAVMKAFDDGKFRLDDKASDYIPGLRDGDKEDITFRDLLYHETGMPASLNMWYMMMDPKTYNGELIVGAEDANHTIKIMNGAWGHKDAKLRTDILSSTKTDKFNIAIADGIWGGRVTYDSIMNRMYHAKLGKKRYLYSCCNFSLLADAVQRMTHSPLNYYVNNYIFAPLGAYHTMYRPLSKFSREEIAYTEMDTYLRRQHIHGYVHDELAAFSGGVQGNAGLFSNANDLAKLFQMWLNGGTYGGVRLLKASTVETFTTQKSPNSHRGLGFDKPVVGDPEASNTCAEATPETFGHTGFTGTCFWVDPKNDMFYIFLSNRVSPTRNNPNFGRISARSHIHSLIYRAIRD